MPDRPIKDATLAVPEQSGALAERYPHVKQAKLAVVVIRSALGAVVDVGGHANEPRELAQSALLA